MKISNLGRRTAGTRVDVLFACQRCGFQYPMSKYTPDQNITDLRTCPSCADTYNQWTYGPPLPADTSFVLPWYALKPPLNVPPGSEDPVWPLPTTNS